MTSSKNIFKNQLKIARQFFVMSAVYGLLLRLYKVVDFIPIAYKNILQAHSHVTFLGWGFLGVITLIGFVFYPKKLAESKYLSRLFTLKALMLLGMLISFPLQGYKVFSIVFLSVFGISSYFYLARVLKFLKIENTIGLKFVKTGIWYYFLSSIAIWGIAFVTINYGKITLYYNTVYFYLHFLYNGFFVFTLFGLWINYLEKKDIGIEQKPLKVFYLLLNITCIPAYALSTLWTDVPLLVNLTGGFAGLLQLVSLWYLFGIYKVFFQSKISQQVKWISLIVFGSYFLKVTLQFFSAFPNVINAAVRVKPFFIVGYLHLFTLGFMSMFIFLLISIYPKIILNKVGLILFVIGFLLSELLLFLNGFLVLNYQYGIQDLDWMLLFVSVLMPVGLIFIYFDIKIIWHKKR